MEIPFSYKVLGLYADNLPKPEDIGRLVTEHTFEVTNIAEKDGDTIITADILPNRAHDASSYHYFAKEICAISDAKLKDLPGETKEGNGETAPSVTIEDEDCNRYMGRLMTGISVGKAPEWIADSLVSMGQKSINNIVDATNFIMWSVNQPLHAFDADKLASHDIVVRKAKAGERMTTLDGKDVEFDGSELVIADSEGPIAIAGIKGGNRAEVDENTKNILLESANFDSVSIRKTARGLGISTDSSVRFEHQISPELAEFGMNILTNTILEMMGEEVKMSDIVDQYPERRERKEVQVSVETVNKILGTSLAKEDVSGVLGRLQFEYTEEGDTFSVAPPMERVDLTNTEDLVEEIGRIYGYNNIESRPISEMDFKPEVLKTYYYRAKLENLLSDNGFSQIETYSLVPKGDVEIANPLASDKCCLRNNLLDGMNKALDMNIYNADLLGLSEVKMFEIGHVFSKDGESTSLGIVVGGKNKKGYKDIIDGIVDQLEGSPRDFLKEGNNGVEIDFTKYVEYLPDQDSYEGLLSASEPVAFKVLSQYPFVTRDIAVWVPSTVSSEELCGLLEDEGGQLLVRSTLFDEFEKDGRTSYAFRLVFQSHEKTLTDAEVNEIMDKICGKIAEKEGWEAR